MAAGVLTGDFLLRLPLDDFWPRFTLAPYIFAWFRWYFAWRPGEQQPQLVRAFP